MKSKEFLELMGNIDEKFLVEEEKNLFCPSTFLQLGPCKLD